MKNLNIFIPIVLLLGGLFAYGVPEKAEFTVIEELGKELFFDDSLSSPVGQSCSTCHGQEAGWSGPDSEINKKWAIYHGADPTRFGNRRPPTAAYAGLSPTLHRDSEGTFVGGMFWDGRATGWEINDPLAEQAMGPFLNPLEQNLPDQKSLVEKVRKSSYADLFIRVWGKDSLSDEQADKAFERIARSIAAFERSDQVNPFSSRFDDFWRRATGLGLKVETIEESDLETFKGHGLTDREVEGLMLFNTKGKCAECHPLTPVNNLPPLFTDFTYDNLGVPANPANPFYKMGKEWNPDGKNWKDPGLGGFLEGVEKYRQYARENLGKHKVPTLRNVDLRPSTDFIKSFMHNGYFKTLEDVIHFYNTRDKKDAGWPEPEIKANLNTEELGTLGLIPEEEKAIVLFMKTLSDR